MGEEIRKKESLEEERKAEEKIARRKRELEAKQAEDAATRARGLSNQARKTFSGEGSQTPHASTLLSNLFSKKNVDSPIPLSSGLRKGGVLGRKKTLSDGVQAMTGNGRLSAAATLQLQDMKEVESRSNEIQSRQQRRCFNKSISDGVAFMREVNSDLEVPAENQIIISDEDNGKYPAIPSTPKLYEADVMMGYLEKTKLCNEFSDFTSGGHERKHSRRFMKTQSEGVSCMRSSTSKELKMLSFDPETKREPERLVTLSELAQISAKDLPEIPAFKQKIRSNRHQRKKSASDGVTLMRSGVASITTSVASISASSMALSGLTQSSATVRSKYGSLSCYVANDNRYIFLLPWSRICLRFQPSNEN